MVGKEPLSAADLEKRISQLRKVQRQRALLP